MNVIRLAFPNIHLLTRSYTSSSPRTEAASLENVVGIATTAGLPDRSWRACGGPQPRTGEAGWLRGDLGGIACLVHRPEGTLLHLMARDGTPIAIVRRVSALRDGRTTAV